jgi:hypothetical protein
MVSIDIVRAQLKARSNLNEEAIDFVAPVFVLRASYVQDMASAVPMSPEWNEASRRITECDCILAQFDLV